MSQQHLIEVAILPPFPLWSLTNKLWVALCIWGWGVVKGEASWSLTHCCSLPGFGDPGC